MILSSTSTLSRYMLSSAMCVILASGLCTPLTAQAESVQATTEELPTDLTEVGLKRLLDFDLVVTSAGRKDQRFSDVSSALYVLSHEDIKRSGVTHVVEALRLVPGVNVAQVSSTQWAVSIRGFSQVYAHKLLVLIDGVTVFSPLTNGVYWETLDPYLNDIERIEVIRGPGAALWGSNAVNGVINIITKNAKATQGSAIQFTGGTNDNRIATARHGAALGEDSFFRIAGTSRHAGENTLVSGGEGSDSYEMGSVDSRYDTKLSESAKLTWLGHAFKEHDDVRTQTPITEPPYVDELSYSGRGTWKGGYTGLDVTNEFSRTSKLRVLGSALYQERDSNLTSLEYSSYDLDVTHQFSPTEGQDLVYGVSGRIFDHTNDGTFAQDFIPRSRTMERLNWFVQDEIALQEDLLHLVVGSKFEKTSTTDFQYMPNARLIWTPDKKNSVWGAISRAVSPPSRVFQDIRFPVASVPPQTTDGLPTLIEIVGDRQVQAAEVLSYETGYRSEITEGLSLDLAFYYSRYKRILTQEPGTPYVDIPHKGTTPTVIVPLRFANGLAAQSFGSEIALEWRPTSWWRLVTAYSYLEMNSSKDTTKDASSNYLLVVGSAARHQALVRSLIDITDKTSFDSTLRFVDNLRFGDIDAYTELDVRLGWKASKDIELSLIGKNLLDSHHPEYIGNLFGPLPLEINRQILGSILWSF